MRKIVAKRCRKEALQVASETKYTVRQKVKRYLTGKEDETGRPITRDINRNTLICTGFRRAYQDLKKAYRERRSA